MPTREEFNALVSGIMTETDDSLRLEHATNLKSFYDNEYTKIEKERNDVTTQLGLLQAENEKIKKAYAEAFNKGGQEPPAPPEPPKVTVAGLLTPKK